MRPETARPLYVLLAGTSDASIGTGFIVVDEHENTWLVTAAHTPTRQQRPTLDFAQWPSTLHLMNAANGAMPISLFVGTAGRRAPAFRFLPNTMGSMADMLALPLTRSVITAVGFDEASFVSFRQPVRTPQPIGPIIGYGYPHLGMTWPYAPPNRVDGDLIDTSGIMYQGTLQTHVGHSGGPVFTPAGNFVGMMIGSTDGVAQIVPDILLKNFVNGRLRTF